VSSAAQEGQKQPRSGTHIDLICQTFKRERYQLSDLHVYRFATLTTLPYPHRIMPPEVTSNLWGVWASRPQESG